AGSPSGSRGVGQAVAPVLFTRMSLSVAAEAARRRGGLDHHQSCRVTVKDRGGVRHKSAAVLAGYMRRVDLFKNDACGEVRSLEEKPTNKGGRAEKLPKPSSLVTRLRRSAPCSTSNSTAGARSPTSR